MREWNEEWERKIKDVKREHKVWEIVNRERKGRKRVNEDIEMGEWKEYFSLNIELVGRSREW